MILLITAMKRIWLLQRYCFNFPFISENIDSVIIGLNSVVQLQQNIELLKNIDNQKETLLAIRDKFRVDSKAVLLPYNW